MPSVWKIISAFFWAIFDLTRKLPELIEGVDYFPEEGATYQSLGGTESARLRKEKGQMMHDPEWQKKYNGGYSPNNPFKDPEFQRNVIGGNPKAKFTLKCHKAGGKASTSIKYKCSECDMISNIGGITSHRKSSGHLHYERLNGNKIR